MDKATILISKYRFLPVRMQFGVIALIALVASLAPQLAIAQQLAPEQAAQLYLKDPWNPELPEWLICIDRSQLAALEEEARHKLPEKMAQSTTLLNLAFDPYPNKVAASQLDSKALSSEYDEMVSERAKYLNDLEQASKEIQVLVPVLAKCKQSTQACGQQEESLEKAIRLFRRTRVFMRWTEKRMEEVSIERSSRTRREN